MGEIITYVLAAEGTEYAFVPPFEWRAGAESSRQRVVLTSRDRTASITIAFTPPNPALQADAEAGQLKEQVLKRFPGGRIVEEYPSYTANQTGRGFEVLWTGPGNVQMTSRIVFFPTKTGGLEFHLTAATVRFKTVSRTIGSVITSFQEVQSSPARKAS